MLRTLYVPSLVGVAVVLLPSVAVAGGTGACYVLEAPPALPQTPLGAPGLVALCLDGLTQQQCDELLLSKGGSTGNRASPATN